MTTLNSKVFPQNIFYCGEYQLSSVDLYAWSKG